MKDFQKLSMIAIPAVLGLGAAWLGIRIIENENKLRARQMELELQLAAKSFKDL